MFFSDFTFLESALYVNFFAIVSMVDFQPSLGSVNLQRTHNLTALSLLGLRMASYLIIAFATLASLRWQTNDIGSTPILNILLRASAAPALMAWLVKQFHRHKLPRPALFLATTMALGFVSLEIRRLWQARLNLSLPTGSAELYPYSIVWLLFAVTALLAVSWRLGVNCYRVGLGILTSMIAKIFLLDMDDLEGLLRVASFTGLGSGSVRQ